MCLCGSLIPKNYFLVLQVLENRMGLGNEALYVLFSKQYVHAITSVLSMYNQYTPCSNKNSKGELHVDV